MQCTSISRAMFEKKSCISYIYFKNNMKMPLAPRIIKGDSAKLDEQHFFNPPSTSGMHFLVCPKALSAIRFLSPQS